MDSASDPESSGEEIFSDGDIVSEDEAVTSDDEREPDVEHEHAVDGSSQQWKRRKLDKEEALHGAGAGIDHAEDAEASLLALEVRELLAETAAPKAVVTALTSAAHRITEILQALPAAEVDPSSVSALLSNFNFPASRKFTFHAPSEVTVIGTFAINAAAAMPTPTLDLAIQMPAECFDNKDQLNHRYHAKRALYVAHIAETLQQHRKFAAAAELKIASLRWDAFRGDPRRPVLIVHLKEEAGGGGGGAIRLIPVAPLGLFPLAKLAPNRNNLRCVCKPAVAVDGAAAVELLPTPHYNCGILQDMLMVPYSQGVKKASRGAAAMNEASVLLKVWAGRQRLDEGADGVDGFFLTALLAQLLENGNVSSGMSGMHLFRATLLALHHPKTFSGSGLSMLRTSTTALHSSSSSSSSPSSPPSVKSWRTAGHEVIFLDATGWMNLAAHVSVAALKQAQAAAHRTTKLLSSSSGPDAFDAVFLIHHPLASLYDAWYRVMVPEEHVRSTGSAMYDSDYPYWNEMDKKAAEIGKKALGSRASLVRVIHRGAKAVEVVEDSSKKATTTKKSKKKKGNSSGGGGGGVGFSLERPFILLGARLDPTVALRGVDIGPAADSGPAAAQFRTFWGDKSELRRFQDGKISEAVVWEVSPSTRHVIVDAVLQYAVQRHLPPGTTISQPSSIIDSVLLRKQQQLEDAADADVAAVRLCEDAAARLSKRLRTLDGLTLKIVGTQPLAAVLRHTDVFPPQPHPLAGAARGDLIHSISQDSIPRCLPAVEILCQLEGSGKWPDAPAAFAKMKAAVGVELAQLLHSSFGIEASAAEDYVDILSDGFAFRLILHTERDAAMQKMMLTAAGLSHHPLAEQDIGLRMWHQGTLSAAAAANPAFEPSVRLAKRWIASQWLSPHFQEEGIELLVAVAFSSGDGVAAPPPGSRVAGFLRFLRLLGTHPWAAAPLVGDVSSGDPGSVRRDAAARAHAAQRAAGTAPALFITGPKDDECVGWTKDCPSKPMLFRAGVLARRAAEALETALLSPDVDDDDDEDLGGGAVVVDELFQHDVSEYEVLIHLRADALSRGDMSLSTTTTSGMMTSSSLSSSSSSSSLPSKRKKVVFTASTGAASTSKSSRAVLKGIPKSVLQTRGATAVRRELLVGFDPLPLYCLQLEERFSEVAVVCADYYGGTAVGLKLRGSVLQPGAFRPEIAHAMRPLVNGDEGEMMVVVPDLAAIAADVAAIGAGLVEKVEYFEEEIKEVRTIMTQNPLSDDDDSDDDV